MHDDIVIRWSFTHGGSYMAGDIRVGRDVWDPAAYDERRRLVREGVGSAVISVLDVDWDIHGGALDDPQTETPEYGS